MRDYKILSATTVDHLAEDVTIALNNGWELVGETFTSHDGKMLHQAIIKVIYDKPNTNIRTN